MQVTAFPLYYIDCIIATGDACHSNVAMGYRSPQKQKGLFRGKKTLYIYSKYPM